MKPLLILLFLFSSSASADIYKSIDSEGNAVFSDRPSSGATKLVVPPPPPVPPVRQESPVAPASEPEKKPPSNERRKALQRELESEQLKLIEAKDELRKAQDYISGMERNDEADIDKTARLEDEIARHEKAIEEIRKRISEMQ